MLIYTVYHFVDSNLGVEVSSKNGLTEKEKEIIEIEDRSTSAHLYWGFKKISCKASQVFFGDKKEVSKSFSFIRDY